MDAYNRTLANWMTKIKERQVVLPRFQRFEAWEHSQVRDLLQTVVDGLPAGALLVLNVGDNIPFVCRSVQGAPNDGEKISELLLDGQQRITALWRSLKDDYNKDFRTFFIYLPQKDSLEGAQVVSQARYLKNGQLYPLWANDPVECWQRRYLPVRLLDPSDGISTVVTTWAMSATQNDAAETLALVLRVQQFQQRFREFNLPFLALPIGTERSIALNVFIKMNTSLTRLTTFDIIVAQTEGATGESLHDLVQEIHRETPLLWEYHSDPSELLLSVAALRQDRSPNQTGHLGMDLEQMVREWHKIKQGVHGVIQFLEEEKVFDAARLPTEVVLAPLIALWSQIPTMPDAAGNARTVLRKYLWRSFFTDRYERGAATYALQDYRALVEVICNQGQEQCIPCFDEKSHPLPEKEALIAAVWPTRRDRLAKAISLLALRGNALDIADGTPVSRAHLKKREYHHLFPVAYLKTKDFTETEAFCALNCAIITWRTNRTISAKEPATYLRERTEAATLGEAEIRARLATHLVSYDAMHGEYYDFLNERAEAAYIGIVALCRGEVWSP